MSIELITLLYFGYLFAGLFLGLPIALGLGATAVILTPTLESQPLLGIPSAFYHTPWNHVLVTVPLFLFMGSLIRFSGIAKAAYDTGYKWIGYLPDGLAIGTVKERVFGSIQYSSLVYKNTYPSNRSYHPPHPYLKS